MRVVNDNDNEMTSVAIASKSSRCRRFAKEADLTDASILKKSNWVATCAVLAAATEEMISIEILRSESF